LSKKITSKNPNEAFREMEELVAYARSGSGPVFLEIETYRYVEHCGPNPDDNLNYRPAKEIVSWRENDFVDSILEFAKSNNVDLDALAKIENFILRKIDKAFYRAKNDPFPTLSDTLIDVYAGAEND
jgi:pyruvate dehydrogenase E1 component alpha subunit